MEIHLSNYGEFLGVRNQNFVINRKDRQLKEVPFYEVKRVIVSSGNCVSSSALFWLAAYGVETLITSKTGKVVSVLVPYLADNRVDTRLKQY